MSEKNFLTYHQQMKELRNAKKISCSGSADKEILCRCGYFNLVNGYKQPFIAGTKPDGKYVYYAGTSIKELYALKQFDDNLRNILLNQIKKVEEEVRTVFAYKLDQNNKNGKIAWYQLEAYDNTTGGVEILRAISKAYRDIDRNSANQDYIKYYLEKHKFIPTWILMKVIDFSSFLSLLKYSKNPIKIAMCKLYGIFDSNGDPDFLLLIGSLHWFRIVRNSCAHNQRIYTLKRENGRIKEEYMRNLAPSYLRERDQKIVDLLVYMKYYCPHNEYVDFIDQIYDALTELKNSISSPAFDYVRSALGIKDIEHLHKLCQNKKGIDYNKIDKL